MTSIVHVSYIKDIKIFYKLNFNINSLQINNCLISNVGIHIRSMPWGWLIHHLGFWAIILSSYNFGHCVVCFLFCFCFSETGPCMLRLSLKSLCSTRYPWTHGNPLASALSAGIRSMHPMPSYCHMEDAGTCVLYNLLWVLLMICYF